MRWFVEVVEERPRRETVRMGPHTTEERARAAFARETVETYGYRGLASDAAVIEIRLVEESEPGRGEMYGRRRLLDLVVRFCSRCTALGNEVCAEAVEEVARRVAS